MSYPIIPSSPTPVSFNVLQTIMPPLAANPPWWNAVQYRREFIMTTPIIMHKEKRIIYYKSNIAGEALWNC